MQSDVVFYFSVVVLKVKVTHEPNESPDDIQKDIVQKLKQLQDKTVPKTEGVWRFLSQLKRFNIEIVSARWDKGVVMWFWCRSQIALDRVESMNRTEEVSMKGPAKATSEKLEFHKFTTLLNGLFTLLLSGKTPPTISSVFLDNPDKDVGKNKSDVLKRFQNFEPRFCSGRPIRHYYYSYLSLLLLIIY